MSAHDLPPSSMLRGKLTGFRLFATCVLGCWLGFVPGFLGSADQGTGFAQAPGLIVGILAAALVVRTHLLLFAVTVALAKLAALPLVGVAFSVGQVLLDGPTSGLFAALINAPVLAWCGLEYYATTGGLAIGTLLGIAWCLLLGRLLRTSVPATAAEPRRTGLPVRLTGVIAVLVLAATGWLFQEFLGSKLFQDSMRKGLEYGNGATVELDRLGIDLGRGEVVVDGLAMADANNLELDLFRATRLKLQLGTTELLSRRLVIKDVTSETARTRVQRSTPGQRIVDPAAPPPPPPRDGDKTLEDYLADAKVWEQYLRQANQWLETIFRSPTDETDADRDRRIADQRRTLGPAAVAALHLIQGAPLVLVEKVSLVGIEVGDRPGETIDIRASNLSTNPGLVAQPAALSIQSGNGSYGLEIAVAPATGKLRARLFHKALPVDAVVARLKPGGSRRIRGGTLGFDLAGDVGFRGDQGLWIDLPLQVELRGTTFEIAGMQPTRVESLQLPLGLRGPIAALRVRFDDARLGEALVAAGKAELANQLRQQADKLLGDKVPQNLKDSVQGVLSGKPEDAAKKAADELKKQADEAAKKAEEDLRKRAAEALQKGLFGRKKN